MGQFNPFINGNGGGGGGGSGDKSRYTVRKTTNSSTGEVTFALLESIDGGTQSQAGDTIDFQGTDIIVHYKNITTTLDAAISDLEQRGGFHLGTVATVTGQPGTQASVVITPDQILENTYNFTFTVPQGATGATGADGNGISSISKTGTSGLVDTYTITYNDNTHTTFTVTNGAEGTSGYSPTVVENGENTTDIYRLDITYKNGGIIQSYTTPNLKGAVGSDGVSITGATINNSGELVLSLSDGNSINVGVVKGADGTSINIISSLSSTSELPSTGQVRGDAYLIDGDLWVYTASTEAGAVNGFINAGQIQGPAGRGVSSIAKTSTSGLVDTYTITYSDTTTSTFTVTNGKGISSVLKTSTSGLVDTYTITYTDNTTSTFNITNGATGATGQDGSDGISVVGAAINGSNHLILTMSNGNTIDAGLMPAPSQNTFSSVKVGASTISADSSTDTIELIAGNNVTLTPDTTNDTVTIAATDTTYSVATASTSGVGGSDGLMAAADKEKLNGVAVGAEVNQNTFSSVKVGNSTIEADGKTDTIELIAGTNIILTPDTTNDTVTIATNLGTAATKDYTTSVTSGSNDLVTSGAVYTAIDNLPEPMVFKGSLGTGGTITVLPIDGSATIGDTYKVITDGTYASKAAKVGDTFICLTKTSNANTWELIPSGDEPSGTVTSIKIEATSPIAIDNSSAITTSGTRTISHAVSGATAGSYGDSSSQTPNYGGTFKVPYVTVNETGHVTSISEHTVQIPASDNTNTTYTLSDETTSATQQSVKLTPSSGTANTVSVVGKRVETISGSNTYVGEIFNSYSGDNVNIASGNYCHAEGGGTIASYGYSHAEGRETTASGYGSHAEGRETTASNDYCHAEGYKTTASGLQSHAEGRETTASGSYSHATGLGTFASGYASYAGGSHTKASSSNQTALGKYNVEDSNNTYTVIIGNGSSDNNRSNALSVDWNGNIYCDNHTTSINEGLAEAVNNGAKNVINTAAALTSQTVGGITYTINSDGSITVTGGTATSNSDLVIPITLTSGVDYVLSGCLDGGSSTTYKAQIARGTSLTEVVNVTNSTSSATFTAQSGIDYYWRSRVYSGKTVPSGTFYPMLCTKAQWDVSQTYKPYALPNAPITAGLIEAVNEGAKNILTINASTSGIFSSDKKNTITVNGTSTSNSFMNLNYVNASTVSIPPGNWVVAGYGNMSNLRFRYSENDSSKTMGNYGEPLQFTVPEGITNNWVRIECQSEGTTFNNQVVSVMICTKAQWDISQQYEPYAPTLSKLNDIKIESKDVFGYGTLVPDNSDLNDYKTPGIYYVQGSDSAGTIDNIPTETLGKLIVLQGNAASRWFQLYMSSTQLFQRRYTGAAWTQWYEYITRDRVFGRGIQIKEDGDLNDYKTQGVYYHEANTAVTNSPLPTSKAFKLTVKTSENGGYLQIIEYSEDGTLNPKIKSRYYSNTGGSWTWNDWDSQDYFGKGDKIPNGTSTAHNNLNNYTTPGKYYVLSGTDGNYIDNRPAATGFTLIVERGYQYQGSTHGVIQTAQYVSNGTFCVAKRIYYYTNSAWSWLPWSKVTMTT